MVERGLAEGPWSLTDHGKKAEQRLNGHPYDLEAWNVLIREAQSTAILRARMLYERVVTQFPSSGRYWRLYIEQEMRNRNYEQVEKLFQRCLMTVMHIDLWKCYITYVRETKQHLPTFREKLNQTYEFTLEHIGVDHHSTSIRSDYIAFLKSGDAQGTFAENQKTQFLRQAYQSAVVTPIMNIEQIWREYNTFEHTVNKPLAKKHIESVSRQYVNTKRAAAEYEGITRGLIRGGTSVPLRGLPQEAQQLQIWKRYIAWEKTNPTRTEDQALLVRRVLYAHEQCLLCYGHCSDIWYEAALYLQRASETGDAKFGERWAEEASIMYERATTGPLKNSLLLHFAYADFEESRTRFEKAETIYDKLLERRDIDPTLVFVQFMKFARRSGGIKSARNVFRRAREDIRVGYQVFISAALMEYNISKDKSVAFKIFELGSKRFGDNPNYTIEYLDHLSHLNEDNNTRVLFEKAVSTMPPEKTSEIWEKFVEFEAGVGDLASLLKVERRRSAILRNEDGRSKESILLVDRYRYLSLLPCSEVELKLMGHPLYAKLQSSSSSSSSSSSPTPVSRRRRRRSSTGLDLQSSSIVKPDVKQMLPFKPSCSSGVGMNAVPGGHFPVPSACAHLMSQLPPPQCFHGPFVKLDELTQLIVTAKVLENISGDPDEARAGKRRREGEDSGDETAPPPINDIYRTRQQKRVHT